MFRTMNLYTACSAVCRVFSRKAKTSPESVCVLNISGLCISISLSVCKEGLVQDEATKECREKERSTGDNNQSPNLGPV